MMCDLSDLEKAFERKPKSLLFARLAAGYLEMGETQRAMDICAQGLEHYPSYVNGRVVMGKCFMASGSFVEARREFKRVLRLDPENISAFWHLAQINKALGSTELALRNLERALLLDPLNRALKEEISALMESAQEKSDVEAEEQPASQDRGPVESLGIEKEDQRKAELDQIPQGVEIESSGKVVSGEKVEEGIGDQIATVTLAEIYASQGLLGKAIEILERILKRDPGNQDVKERLVQLKAQAEGEDVSS